MVRLSKRIGDVGRMAERALARRLSGRQTLGSGALHGDKGDIEIPDWLLEAKSTVNGSFGVTHSMLAKIEAEAHLAGRKPAFALMFTDDKGTPKRSGSWVAVPEYLFKEIVARGLEDASSDSTAKGTTVTP